ncbi:MAG: hypothetical protein WC712_05440 [Candidatus Brocadiia bacterium]
MRAILRFAVLLTAVGLIIGTIAFAEDVKPTAGPTVSPSPTPRPVPSAFEQTFPAPGTARADLVIPDPLWNKVLDEVGFGTDGMRRKLGFLQDQLTVFGRGTKYILPRVRDLFTDVRAIPNFTGKMSDDMLAAPDRWDRILSTLYEISSSESGYVILPEETVQYPDWLAKAQTPAARVLAALEKIGPAGEGDMPEPAAWISLPGPVLDLLAGLMAAAVEAEPELRAANSEPWLLAHFGVKSLDEIDRDALFLLASDPVLEMYTAEETKPILASYELMDVFNRKALARATAIWSFWASAALRKFMATPWEGIEGATFDEVVFMTRLGTVRISDTRPTKHAGGDFICIDIGGDDIYTGYTAAPNSLSRPFSFAIDLGGNDSYTAGSVANEPKIEAEEFANAVGGGTYGLYTVPGKTRDEFVKGVANWAIEVRDGILYVWDKREKAVAEALAKGERPTGLVIRENATRFGAKIASTSDAAINAFCWDRRAFMMKTDGYELDVYFEDSPELAAAEGSNKYCALAAGMFGIGALFDLGGDDAYLARRSGIGNGLFGTGLLYDAAGNDSYRLLRSWGIGTGHSGVGLLIDREGNDKYFCGSMAQGFGGTLGAGALMDCAGDDRYIADLDGRREDIYINQSVSFVQGSACGRRADMSDKRTLAGGFGILVDGAGNDFYESGAYGQGNAYWWCMGVFEDRSGNDSYHMMQYGLGTAPHFAAGVFVDLAGNDKYNTDFPIMQRLIGHGRDGSIGIFFEGAGDDEYKFTSDSCGSADLNTIALFWDRMGDDTYNFIPTRTNERGFGDVCPYEPFKNLRDEFPSVGIFLDTGGNDKYLDRFDLVPAIKGSYGCPGRNDAEWYGNRNPTLHQWGFGLDRAIWK